MDYELDSMLTPVKVNPEDSAARAALATYLTRRNLHHDAEGNLTNLRGTGRVLLLVFAGSRYMLERASPNNAH